MSSSSPPPSTAASHQIAQAALDAIRSMPFGHDFAKILVTTPEEANNNVAATSLDDILASLLQWQDEQKQTLDELEAKLSSNEQTTGMSDEDLLILKVEHYMALQQMERVENIYNFAKTASFVSKLVGKYEALTNQTQDRTMKVIGDMRKAIDDAMKDPTRVQGIHQRVLEAITAHRDVVLGMVQGATNLPVSNNDGSNDGRDETQQDTDQQIQWPALRDYTNN